MSGVEGAPRGCHSCAWGLGKCGGESRQERIGMTAQGIPKYTWEESRKAGQGRSVSQVAPG